MKHNAEILLRILLNGAVVEHKGSHYAMAEDGSLVYLYNKDDETGHKLDYTMRDFVAMANEMSFNDLFIAGANLALRDMAEERVKLRQQKRETV